MVFAGISAIRKAQKGREGKAAYHLVRALALQKNGLQEKGHIILNGHRVVVEVKQVDPNDNDMRAEKELRSGKVTLISVSPGERVRGKITDAASQLKRQEKGVCPSLLVLYNNARPANYTNPYAIETGMYGYEQVVLSVPRDFAVPIAVSDKKFGPKRKMTPQHNTSISGVAVMIADGDRPKELRIYHNVHAAMPLSPVLLHNKGVTSCNMTFT